MRGPSKLKTIEHGLRERALSYPETHEDFPWGESALKVRGKVFLFMHGVPGETLALSLKLPHSADAALLLPFCEPTGYGLGKSGWVSAKFGDKSAPPLALLLEWLEESFRAVAPKKLVAQVDAAPAAPVNASKRTKVTKVTKKKQR